MYYPTRNQQPAIGNVVIPPSPLSSPRRVEEFLIINCHLPIVVFGRPHRVAPTDNLAVALLLLINGFPLKFIPEKSGTGMTFLVCNATLFCHSCINRNPVLIFPIGNQQPAIGNVVIPPHLYPLPVG